MSDHPSTWKYVGVWLLAASFGNLASKIIVSIVFADVRSVDEIISAMMFGIPLEAVAVGLCLVAVYSVFSSLNMSAVFPWMVGLSSLGLLINLITFVSWGYVPGWVYVYQVFFTAVMLYAIRVFFKSKGRIT